MLISQWHLQIDDVWDKKKSVHLDDFIENCGVTLEKDHLQKALGVQGQELGGIFWASFFGASKCDIYQGTSTLIWVIWWTSTPIMSTNEIDKSRWNSITFVIITLFFFSPP